MNNIVTSEGAAKTAMCALLMGAVLNIVLDPLFIYVFDLGVVGAAMATAISQAVSTCVYLTYILRKKSVFLCVPRFGKRQRGLYSRSLQTGDLFYPCYTASSDGLGA